MKSWRRIVSGRGAVDIIYNHWVFSLQIEREFWGTPIELRDMIWWGWVCFWSNSKTNFHQVKLRSRHELANVVTFAFAVYSHTKFLTGSNDMEKSIRALSRFYNSNTGINSVRFSLDSTVWQKNLISSLNFIENQEIVNVKIALLNITSIKVCR